MNQKIIQMIKLKVMFVMLLMTIGIASKAQENHEMPSQSANPKLVAVVIRANWCKVCKENGERFGAVLMPYAAKGVNIYMNDLTDAATTNASKELLQKAGVYNKALAKVKQTGVVLFINPQTGEKIKQVSIALADEEMKTVINSLIK
jgi:hypothetical protein